MQQVVGFAATRGLAAHHVAHGERARVDTRSYDLDDHMLVAEYSDGAWRGAAIRPYGPLALLPNISGLNYAAVSDIDLGELREFRQAFMAAAAPS